MMFQRHLAVNQLLFCTKLNSGLKFAITNLNTKKKVRMPQKVHSENELRKYGLLFLGIVLDAIGMLTYAIPFFGELFDLLWAPVSALLVWLLYRKTYGSVGGLFSFFEEILPGADVIPTFTVMWFVRYYVTTEKKLSGEATAQ